MIITDKFIFIHKPKTGGTFVTEVLLELYGLNHDFWTKGLNRLQFFLFKRAETIGRYGKYIVTNEKHAGCNQIPTSFKGREILSTIRNPFDYYVSEYEFGWWKRKEWLRYYKRVNDFQSLFSTFPDLSFPQYLQLTAAAFNDNANKGFNNTTALGYYTVDFIRNHFYNPNQVLLKANEDYFKTGNYINDMYPLHFICTHQLNRQLYDYLLKKDYPKASLDFILKKERVLPLGKGRTEEQKWQKYYTPELKELVRKKDRFLFAIFPEFDYQQ